ncbi:MAG: cysteine desulfurase [Elusimicrobiota bacterium]|jgi:cysteine desulfurase|nr:cysteine desulfurase [Elusimicrobiota bacterium]
MKIYFDNSSTTAVSPAVLDEMRPYFLTQYGNASTLHSFGRDARAALDQARLGISQIINCNPDEIFFTGCGTESDNLALFGTMAASGSKGHIITTKIEHHAVLYTAQALQKAGYTVTFLDVDKQGLVSVESVKAAITADTKLVSVMQANNEVGTLEPIAEIGKMIAELNLNRANKIYFHTDAVQSIGKIAIDVKNLGVDMLSASAHKFNGPKGVGFLYVKRGTNIFPIMYGGHQENGLRPGTENIAEIVGMAKALQLAYQAHDEAAARLKIMRETLKEGICGSIEDVSFNGCAACNIGNIINVSFNYIEGEALLARLDAHGIAASTGSACATGSPSHVLAAMGVDPIAAQGAIRFSFGKDNTLDEVKYTLSVLPKLVNGLREMSPLWKGGGVNVKARPKN